MKNKHYIAMAGLSGYMPSYCQSHDTIKNAIEDLASIHELSPNYMRKAMGSAHYMNLNLHKHGNEYAEITECHCNEPEVHNDY